MAETPATAGTRKPLAKQRQATSAGSKTTIKKNSPTIVRIDKTVSFGGSVARKKVLSAPGKLIPVRSGAADTILIVYARNRGVDDFVSRVAGATPMQIVEAERHGVDGAFLKDLSRRMDVPAVRMFDIVGVPKATAEKKVANKEPIAGAGGQAALGLARLLAIANDIVANSTSPEAQGFDTAKWLGQWIERPQPALGGRKPADLISTRTGLEMATRVLGAIESGAYQ